MTQSFRRNPLRHKTNTIYYFRYFLRYFLSMSEDDDLSR